MASRRTPNHEQLRVIAQWRDSRGRDSAEVAEVPSDLRFDWSDGINGWYARLRERYAAAIEERPNPLQRDAAEVERYGARLTELRERDERLARVVRANRDPDGDEDRALSVARAIDSEVRWLAERLGIPPDPPVGLRLPEYDRDFLGNAVDYGVEVRGEDSRPRWPRPSKPKPPPVSRADKQRQSAERRLEARVVKIVRLLRRTPDLSENEIRKRLFMGRAQVTKALGRALAAERVGVRGSIENHSYFSLPDPIRKTPRLKPPC